MNASDVPRVTSTPSALWLAMVTLVRDTGWGAKERAEDRLGMPFSRFRALRRLERTPRTQRELAEMMGVDAPAMTGIVSDLVARGLVTRTVHPDDGRAKLVSISAAGRRVLEDYRTAPDLAPPMFEELGAEQRTELAGILQALLEATA